ncbi:MAG: helicase HerA-like domain-containing protein [Gammaproteobacteria bacterium]
MNQHEIYLGKGKNPVRLLMRQANRHGLIAGATGTGKTVTLRIMAEGFSRRGIPVFMADAKGDLSGLAAPSEPNEKFAERAETIGYEDYRTGGFPVVFWDLYGRQGHPVRATVQDMGPILLARMMELTEAQEGILNVAFSVAEDEDLPLLDFQDLRSLLGYVSDRSKELRSRYGNVSPQSVGAIQRKLLQLERQSAEDFFGEPELELDDILRTDRDGRGRINILAADKLMQQSPRLYAIFLMWLLSRLFEELPERGDADKPVMVFFFDEAHLLFDGAPKALVDQVERVVRLIRSKGVGVYFVTQNPTDIPDDVLGQLGNRVQHALRAFTAKDQKAVRAAAQTFRENPEFAAEEAIKELGTGEALISTLDEKGIPGMVERALVIPPSSRLGPLSVEERQAVLDDSPVLGKYDEKLDRDSAHERLQQRKAEMAARAEPRTLRQTHPPGGRPGGRQSVAEALAKSVVRSVGSNLGRQITRAILNSIFKK